MASELQSLQNGLVMCHAQQWRGSKLSFCVISGLLYLSLTAIPLSTLSSPFGTPISELIRGLRNYRQSGEYGSDPTTIFDDPLFQIVYEKLILSGKDLLLGEAVSEVASPYFGSLWIEILCKTNTPKILHRRLQECSKPESGRESSRNLESLENHLLAFFSFVEPYDRSLAASIVGSSSRSELSTGNVEALCPHHHYPELYNAFCESLYSPFHTWNYFPPGLQPLAFALRTNILSLLSTCPISCREDLELRMDFDPSELPDRPWEMSHQDIPSTHRLHFLKAACRGLMQDQNSMPVVRTVSAYILCIRIAKATLTASLTGRSKWASDHQRKRTYKLAAQYIKELYKVKVAAWETTVDDSMRDILSVEMRVAAGEIGRDRASVPVNLLEGLRQPSHRTRAHAIRCSIGGVADKALKIIARMVVYDGDEDVRDDGLDLLKALPNLKLPHGAEETPLLTNPLHGAIEAVLTEVIYLGLSAYEDRLLSSSVQFVEKLLEFTSGFTRAVKKGVHHYWSRQVSGEHSKSRSTFLEALQAIFNESEFPEGDDRLPLSFVWPSPSAWVKEMIKATYEALVNVATSEELVLDREAAQKVLALVARDDRFNSLKLVIMKQLRALTKERTWWVRVNALAVLELFALQASVPFNVDLVQEILILALKDNDENVREVALRAIIKLLEERNVTGEYAPTVRTLIVDESRDKIIASETLDRIKVCWIPFLVSIGKHVSFPEAIPFFVERAVIAPIGGDINDTVMEFFKSDKFAKGAPRSHFTYPTVTHIASHPEYVVAFEKPLPRLDGPLRATLPGETQLRRRNWIKILLNLLPADSYTCSPDRAEPSDIQKIATEALAHVKRDIAVCIEEFSGGKETKSYPARVEDSSFLSKSSLPAKLRSSLGSIPPEARCHWVETLGGLAHHFDFPGAGRIIVQLAVHDPDSDVRVTSMKYLSRIAEQGMKQSALVEDLAAHVGEMAEDRWWLGQLAAFQLHGMLPQAQNGGFPYMGKTFDFALKGDTELVRDRATSVLVQLLTNENMKPVTTEVAKSLASYIASKDDRQLAESLLRKLTASSTYGDSGHPVAGKPDSSPSRIILTFMCACTKDRVSRWHGVWIQVVILLGKDRERCLPYGINPRATLLTGRAGFPPVAEIIQVAIRDAIPGTASKPGSHLQIEKLPIRAVAELPRYILSGLRSEKPGDRLDAVNLSTHLLSSGLQGGQEKEAPSNHKSLLTPSYDNELVSQWSEIAIKDGEPNLREAALNLLKSLLHTDRFHSIIKSSLGGAVKACFEEQNSTKVVKDAIEALHGLTKVYSYEHNERLRDIISPSIPHLMRITMGAGWGHDEVRKEAKVILLEDLTGFSKELQVTKEVLDGLPAMIQNLTDNGLGVALQFVESLQLTDETATSFAKGLTPLLSAAYPSFSRGIALSLLSKLHSKHISSKPQLIQCLTSAIQEITALALDERDEVSGVRTTALQLLVALCRARKDIDSANGASPAKRLIHLLDRIMGLLQNENLRPSVAELLSMMAADPEVRRRISLEIITSTLGEDRRELQGNAALLSRLISDGRFEDNATDNAVLFLASTMLTKPELAPHRFEISTALWCRYREKTFTDRDDLKLSDDFVGLFILALFGAYVSVEEVKTFSTQGEAWISQKAAAIAAHLEGEGPLAMGPMQPGPVVLGSMPGPSPRGPSAETAPSLGTMEGAATSLGPTEGPNSSAIYHRQTKPGRLNNQDLDFSAYFGGTIVIERVAPVKRRHFAPAVLGPLRPQGGDLGENPVLWIQEAWCVSFSKPTCLSQAAMSSLKVDGSRIFDASGNEVVLHGAGLGGWMCMENFVTGYPGWEHQMREGLVEAIGKDKAEFFFDKYLEHFFAEPDAIFFKSLGLNCIRIAVNYRHFEDDENPRVLKTEGFKHLDRAMEICAKHSIYTVIDIHTAPGGQSGGWHSDAGIHHGTFWRHKDFQDRLVWLWEQLAAHYKGNPWIAGYNPLNEPCNPFPDQKGLIEIYDRLHDAIRAIDEEHIIFLDGNSFATDFSKFPDDAGTRWRNTAYSIHDYTVYGFPTTPEPYVGSEAQKERMVKTYLRRREWMDKRGLCVWNGEWGPVYARKEYDGDATERINAERYAVLRDQLEIYEKDRLSWSIWLYKDLGFQGMVYVSPDTPYRRRFGEFIAKKHRLAVDSWGRDDKEVKHLYDPLVNLIKESVADESHLVLYPPRWHVEERVTRLIRTMCLAELMVKEWTGLFKGLDEAQLEELARSFAFENCLKREGLNDVLTAHAARVAKKAQGSAQWTCGREDSARFFMVVTS
ncbi:hypothetical protein NMY22_g8729 [Coprinellus aureogranulatus]|nr:hypothetical protein NMY22_g8729 [Coprinellus aureogranulatus]